jgi:hypothetical protein
MSEDSWFSDRLLAITDLYKSASQAHLEKGELCASLEAALVARAIEKREFKHALNFADEYWGSLERLG